jgi:glycosyltransferase involved in cell wall biosynthesis
MEKDLNRNIPVTVLMPVYNAGKYVHEAIQSILVQTYSTFEFIIINDGSTDETESIILSFTDPRIKYICNKSNLGIVATLNLGLELANGKYIARMDADDIAHEERLSTQIEFLEANEHYGLCGSWYENFGSESGDVKMPVSYDSVRLQLLFHTAFAHPSVIFRARLVKEAKLAYSQTHIYAEDYHLWIEMITQMKGTNLPLFLLKYRVHDTNLSVINKLKQTVNAGKARTVYLDYFFKGYKHSPRQKQILFDVFNDVSVRIISQEFDFIQSILDEIYMEILSVTDYRAQLIANLKYIANKFYVSSFKIIVSRRCLNRLTLFDFRIITMIVIKRVLPEEMWSYIKSKS